MGVGEEKDIFDEMSLILLMYNISQNGIKFARLKSKELTHTRISRALLHILLNLTEEDFALAGVFSFAPYLRLLGFRKSAAPLLSTIKKNADIPLIAKLADAKSYLSDDACALLSKDIFAADVYRLALTAKTGKRLPNEFSHSPIVF